MLKFIIIDYFVINRPQILVFYYYIIIICIQLNNFNVKTSAGSVIVYYFILFLNMIVGYYQLWEGVYKMITNYKSIGISLKLTFLQFF